MFGKQSVNVFHESVGSCHPFSRTKPLRCKSLIQFFEHNFVREQEQYTEYIILFIVF